MHTIGRKVIIKVDEQPTQTKSGLFLPNDPNAIWGKRPQTGTIIATPNNSTLKVGDRVIFPKYWDRYITLQDGLRYLHMKESDVLAHIIKE